MVDRFLRYYHTLKYLRWPQVQYRLWYLIKKAPRPADFTYSPNSAISSLQLTEPIKSHPSWLGENHFEFLNIPQHFKKGIDWNFNQHGKLWVYNLNYFEFLAQADFPKEKGLELIRDFISKQDEIKDGLEPFPISLRVMYWIHFLIKHKIKEPLINSSLFQQLHILHNRIEYHLMGNHLLENGFALLFGALFFQKKEWLETARGILSTQLEEQILADGAHFELSPMYHQIMLGRVLDSINLIQNNFSDSELVLLSLLQQKAALMLGWLQQMVFSDGSLPAVNDSSSGIAPPFEKLISYADRLGVIARKVPLKECGYRKHNSPNYEVLVDVGMIGPDYIPGHAHSDTFNFVLHHNGAPLIVDTGISTYEKNKRRAVERGTAAHNTVMAEEREQSEIWGGFRVARRAKIMELKETDHQITATHDGYKKTNCLHTRAFIFERNQIVIKDKLTGNKTGTAFLHFHSDIKPKLNKGKIAGSFGSISFSETEEIKLVPYEMAIGFNKTKTATKAAITFRDELQTKLTLL